MRVVFISVLLVVCVFTVIIFCDQESLLPSVKYSTRNANSNGKRESNNHQDYIPMLPGRFRNINTTQHVPQALSEKDNNAENSEETLCVLKYSRYLQQSINLVKRGIDKCSQNRNEKENFLAPTDVMTLTKPRDCKDILKTGLNESNLYYIYPQLGGNSKLVWCDMDTDGGGWTVIQRRGEYYPVENKREYFFRDWSDYLNGFGDPWKDHWLGLDDISTLSNMDTTEFRVELTDWNGNKKYAQYGLFQVGGRISNFTLLIGNYSTATEGSDAGNSMKFNNDHQFSTPGADHDDMHESDDEDNEFNEECSRKHHGAWWYSCCSASNLNGAYGKEVAEDKIKRVQGLYWKSAGPTGDVFYSFMKTEMKIRRTDKKLH